MSIDIFCFSFREQRADEGWKNFLEDISVLREVTYEHHKLMKKGNAELSKIRQHVDSVYNEKLHQKRLGVFKSFSDRNYFLPGKTSWECEDYEDLPPGIRDVKRTEYEETTMDYLMRYATIYPGGIREEGKWVMLDNDTALEYRGIQDERYAEIARLMKQNPLTSADTKDTVALTPQQQALKDKCALNNLLYEDTPNDELPYEMALVDLFYGGVSCADIEDASVADFLMAHVEYSGAVLTSLYGESLKENIQVLAKVVTNEFGWLEDESMIYVVDFLTALKPVAKDLKDNPDAVLVCGTGGAYEFDPKNVHDLLIRRAEQHLKEYRGKLLPIL